MAGDILTWILEPDTVKDRLERIYWFLENEGYDLPKHPKDADYSESGRGDNLWGKNMTVKYSTLDKAGRKVYYYVENEVDHIMLSRIENDQAWAISHLGDIPNILKTGKDFPGPGKVTYVGRRKYRDPERGKYFPAHVIIKEYRGLWYVDTFYIVQ